MLAYRRASITRHAAGMQQHLLLCILVAGAASWLTPGFFFSQLQLVLLLLLFLTVSKRAGRMACMHAPACCCCSCCYRPARLTRRMRVDQRRCASASSITVAVRLQHRVAGTGRQGEGARTGCVAWSACTCTGRRLGCSATRQQDSQVHTVCSSHCHSWEGVEEQRLSTSTWWAHLNVWLPCTCCSRDRLVCSHCAWPCLYSCSM